jgi:hypothetical protein
MDDGWKRGALPASPMLEYRRDWNCRTFTPMTDYDLILAGEPVAATAAAKRLISAETVDAAKLRDIALDKNNAAAPRVVAIYALGFTDDGSLAAATLAAIVGDPNDIEECRAHAAEALVQLHAPGIVALIEQILAKDASANVKRWCIRVLGQMDGTQSRNVLLRFAKTNSAGEVVDELRSALSRQWFRTRELGAALRDILRQTRPR